MTFSNNHHQKGSKSNSNNTAWDLACTYSGVGISKPRKMMINRWYAESLTSPTKSIDSLQDQFSTNEIKEYKEKKEELDSPLTSSDSGEDAEEEYTQPSDSHDDDETVSSCSSSEEVKKPKKQSSPKQVKKKTTTTTPVIRKKKKHTTKGQFNTGWWSDDEHQRFLKGLKECGHNWKMISTKYVKTRGRRQCASHAQKWYLSIRYSEEREQMEKM
ncbi:myb, DNA-binding protein [Naegleria gruberi]|uniref:Myb, DNA-binding protein n=1 Tax=Naegleria gruberi TaxID=5762 RepID=D2V112_NAEGR|nr:myb, DNA-binding protein [Naegleria gruberi]EFC49825.1 myb, DNA-binding protein [Naegleria gruberi]|eukprot:XP_002682569.1 myb, DNA-binding protein [Naegleria gruberi strain NEG-M]